MKPEAWIVAALAWLVAVCAAYAEPLLRRRVVPIALGTAGRAPGRHA